MLDKNFDYEGKYFKLISPLKPLCCEHTLEVGSILKVRALSSPNRLIVSTEKKCLHKVKKSALNRCGELI